LFVVILAHLLFLLSLNHCLLTLGILASQHHLVSHRQRLLLFDSSFTCIRVHQLRLSYYQRLVVFVLLSVAFLVISQYKYWLIVYACYSYLSAPSDQLTRLSWLIHLSLLGWLLVVSVVVVNPGSPVLLQCFTLMQVDYRLRFSCHNCKTSQYSGCWLAYCSCICSTVVFTALTTVIPALSCTVADAVFQA